MLIDPRKVNDDAEASGFETEQYDANEFTDADIAPGDYRLLILSGVEQDAKGASKWPSWRFLFGVAIEGDQGPVYGKWWSGVSLGMTRLFRDLLYALNPNLVDPNCPPQEASPKQFRGRWLNVRLGVWGEAEDRLGIEAVWADEDAGAPAAPEPAARQAPQRQAPQQRQAAPMQRPAPRPTPPQPQRPAPQGQSFRRPAPQQQQGFRRPAPHPQDQDDDIPF